MYLTYFYFLILMSNKHVIIAVDKDFFINVFEKKRKNIGKQLGLENLSQTNFTKMIKSLDINLKMQYDPFPKKRKKKIIRGLNGFITI